jgi:hypothetical protein
MTNLLPLIGSAMPAVSVALFSWALPQYPPLIAAWLLDAQGMESAAQPSMPYLTRLYEVRYTLTASFFVLALCLAFLDPLWASASLRIRPMLMAIGFTAAGCLHWLAMAPLSGLGHFFPLLGAVAGTGLLTLALTQAAAYLADSREPLLSAPAQWLASSRTGGSCWAPPWLFTPCCYGLSFTKPSGSPPFTSGSWCCPSPCGPYSECGETYRPS